MMKLVKQRAFGECGAAAIAMVLNCDIADVVVEINRGLARNGLSLQTDGIAETEMVEYLRMKGRDARAVLQRPDSRPAILTVPSLNHRGLLHFIVWDGERYLDPATGPLLYPDDAPIIRDKKTVCWASAIIWDNDASSTT